MQAIDNIGLVRFRPSVPSARANNPFISRVCERNQLLKGILGLHIFPHLTHNTPINTRPVTHKSLTDNAWGYNVASIVKHKKGWRALVNKRGVRKSKVFDSKSAAQDWANRLESEITDGNSGVDDARLIIDILERYRDNESTHKRSHRWEWKKIDHIATMFSGERVRDLTPDRMAQWRDKRMSEVTSGTVNREWNLLNVVFNTAVKQYKWLAENPLSDLKRPTQPPPRDRLISPQEIALIEHTTGFKDCPNTIASRVGAAFLFAIETAMRAGEILSLSPETVSLDSRVAFLPMTKNGTSRKVPLSPRAIELLKLVDCDFQLNSRQLDANFRKCRDMAGIKDLHFHDTRHEAITNLAKVLPVTDLMRICGIKDHRILSVYYNETAENIARRLADAFK